MSTIEVQATSIIFGAVQTKQHLRYMLNLLDMQHENGDISTSLYAHRKAQVEEKLKDAPEYVPDLEEARKLLGRLQNLKESMLIILSDLIADNGLENIVNSGTVNLDNEFDTVLKALFPINEIVEAAQLQGDGES